MEIHVLWACFSKNISQLFGTTTRKQTTFEKNDATIDETIIDINMESFILQIYNECVVIEKEMCNIRL